MSGNGATAETALMEPPEFTPEQFERSPAVAAAMTERFGIEPSHITHLTFVDSDSRRRMIVADASPMGQRIGNWRSITKIANDPAFQLQVEGRQYDTRAGMTWEAYYTMYELAKLNGRPLPDSTGNWRSFSVTLLTGNRPVDILKLRDHEAPSWLQPQSATRQELLWQQSAPYGALYYDLEEEAYRPHFYWTGAADEHSYVRFRHAVEVTA